MNAKKLGEMILNWHGGQYTPEYAAGSSLLAGKDIPTDLAETVASHFDALIPRALAGEFDWAADDAEDLTNMAKALRQIGTTPKLDSFVRAYLGAALWSSNDESDDSGGEPMDGNYGIDDIAPESIAKAIADCAKFRAIMQIDLIKATAHAEENGDEYSGDERNGHDLWLTRNRHGVGFWDRKYPNDLGERLTDAAQAMGEVHAYVGDDGLIYFS